MFALAAGASRASQGFPGSRARRRERAGGFRSACACPYDAGVLSPVTALRAAGRYLRQHPEEFGRAFRNAVGLRFGVPLSAFRYLAGSLLDPSQVEDLELTAVPPGLRMAGTFELMKTRVRGGADLFIDRVVVAPNELRLELRLERVVMIPVGSEKTQISALLHARALDLSRAGDLVANLPDMPEMIVGASDNKLALDLMRVPKLARDARVRHALGLVSTLVTVDRMESEDDHFDLALRPLPQGFAAVFDAVGEHLFSPVVSGVAQLLPPDIRGELEVGVKRVMNFVAGEDPGAPIDVDVDPAA